METLKRILNLKVLKKSRRLPNEGDIFGLQVLDGLFHFGRVIKLKVIAGGFPNSKLLYIYKNTSTNPGEIPSLRKENLLIPPIMTNNHGWSKGYFRFLENRPIADEDVFNVHCFLSDTFDKCFDEYSQPLAKRHEPCGFHGLASVMGIDYEISKALGLPTE